MKRIAVIGSGISGLTSALFGTLQDWSARLSFADAFIQLLEYYFAYCSAGFAVKSIGDIQAFWRIRV